MCRRPTMTILRESNIKQKFQLIWCDMRIIRNTSLTLQPEEAETMSKEWIKIIVPNLITVLVIVAGGAWAIFVHFDDKFERIDDKFEQIDSRLDGIDNRLARVEGWIQGKFDVAPSSVNSAGTDVTDSLIVSLSMEVTND